MRLTFALCLLAAPALAQEPPVAGVLTFIATGAKDGDGIVLGGRRGPTSVIGGVELRLQGVAAPEDRRGAPRTPEGRAATAALDAMVAGALVTCHLDGEVASGSRATAVCHAMVEGAWTELGAEMIRRGFARDCPAYSLSRYADEERAAVAAGSRLAEVYEMPSYCVP